MKVKIDAQTPRSQMIIAIELLEALNQAAGGCEQICFHRRDPRFLLMRDGLNAAKALVIATLPKAVRKGERQKKTIITP